MVEMWGSYLRGAAGCLGAGVGCLGAGVGCAAGACKAKIAARFLASFWYSALSLSCPTRP